MVKRTRIKILTFIAIALISAAIQFLMIVLNVQVQVAMPIVFVVGWICSIIWKTTD